MLRLMLFPFAVVAIWTANNLVIKASSGAVQPGTMAFGRWFIAWLVLAPFTVIPIWKNRRQILPLLPKLMILGGLGMAAFQGAAYFSAQYLSATTIGLFVALVPLMTVILAWLVLRESPDPHAIVGVVVSLLGVILVVSRGQPEMLLQQGIGMGELLMLAGSAAYALYNILLRRWSIPIPRWSSVFLQVGFAALFLLPTHLLAMPAPLSQSGILMLIFAGFFASLAAPCLWIVGIDVIGPQRMTSFTNLVPITTAVSAALFLNEELHSYHLWGGAFIVIGILLVQWSQRQESLAR